MPFNADGPGYDMESALKAGIRPTGGHWPSRVPSGPNEGLLLKGRKHKTWDLLEEGESEAGYRIIKRDGRYWSFPE